MSSIPTPAVPVLRPGRSPARRRRNLEIALHAAIDAKVGTIWIARDIGYRGGRRTGLALTDEPHLDRFSQLYNGLAVCRQPKARQWPNGPRELSGRCSVGSRHRCFCGMSSVPSP